MSEQEYGAQHHEPKTMGIKDYLGLLLVIGGVAIVVWVFMNVYGLFTEPAKLTPFQELVSGGLETSISSAGKDAVKIVIPSEALSYFVPLALLMIAAGLGGILVSGGVRLLDSDIQRLSRRIVTIGSALGSKMDRIQDTLGKK